MCRPATDNTQTTYGYYCNNSNVGALDGSCHGLCLECVCPLYQDCSAAVPHSIDQDFGLYWVRPPITCMHMYIHG